MFESFTAGWTLIPAFLLAVVVGIGLWRGIAIRWAGLGAIGLSLYLANMALAMAAERGAFDRLIVDEYHKLAHGRPETHHLNQWFGTQTEQNPNDAWITQEIIFEVEPDFIIETGTRFGGSATLWATFLHHINPDGRVITIDIENNVDPKTRQHPMWRQHVDQIVSSSTDPQLVAELRARVAGKKVLVILDSDHSRDHVYEEMDAFAPMISVGSYLIVQDTNLNGHPARAEFGPGPMEAVDDWLPDHRNFESDRKRERMLYTLHPKGYLLRTR